MATLLGNKAIGDIVKIGVGGAAREFIVVHKGAPSSLYLAEEFSNTVWVMQRDVDPNVQWAVSNNNGNYASGQAHTNLNSTYLASIEQGIRDQIRQVRIPYFTRAYGPAEIRSGANGLSCKVFLPSMLEVGNTTTPGFGAMLIDGAKLDYFLSGDDSNAQARRSAQRAGLSATWWLRSADTSIQTAAWYINNIGGTQRMNTGEPTSNGARPVFVLPSNMSVTDDGTVFPPTPPEIEALVFERRVHNGSSWGVWQQIGIAPDMYFIDTVPTTGTQVQYRAKAVDNYGQESAYVTGPAKAIDYNKRPTITVEQSDLGTQTGAFSLAFSVDDADAADILTITATADGAPINITDAEGAQVPSITDAVRGQTYSVDISQTAYLRSPGGSHAITITLTDGKATVTQAVAWQRVVGGIDVINGPIGGEMEAMPTQISVSPLVTPMLIDLPSDVTYTVLVCNNCFDVAPAWEDCTTAVITKRVYQFTNATKAAETWGVKVRVTITKGATPTTITLRDVGVSMK